MSVTPGILQGDQFNYLQDVPAGFSPFLLNEAQAMCAEGPSGNIILQYFPDQHYTAWVCDVSLEKKTALQVALPESSMTLLYTLTGNASLSARQQSLQLYEKSYTLLSLYQETPALNVEPGYSRMIFLLFSPLLASLLRNTRYPEGHIQTGQCSEKCLRLLDDIHHNQGGGEIWCFKRQLLLLDLLFTSMEEINHTDQREKRYSWHRDFEKLEQVRAYIHDNIGKKLSVQTLAERFGLTSSQLRRGYKQVYDHHLVTYIRNERLSQAKVLLRQTEMPVHEIAWEVGYESAAGFTRIFTMLFHQSPSGYRRSCQQRYCHLGKDFFNLRM